LDVRSHSLSIQHQLDGILTTGALAEDPRSAANAVLENEVRVRSFEQVFEAEIDVVHGYLSRRVGRSAADDLAAETFATA
jgi:DNA-directed RNA polymerase specialized sigma24 family protein